MLNDWLIETKTYTRQLNVTFRWLISAFDRIEREMKKKCYERIVFSSHPFDILTGAAGAVRLLVFTMVLFRFERKTVRALWKEYVGMRDLAVWCVRQTLFNR